MHNGVPFDLAFRLDEVTRAAYAIVLAGFHGRKFDWSRFDFEEAPS